MPHRVLVVDDDQAIHSLVKESLSNWFTHCLHAYDGETAVRLATEQKPDAVLLDMNMPGLNGWEVCRQIRSNPASQNIPIIFLTSRSDAADKVKGLEMGAADYVTKPFDSDELRLRVRSALRSRDSLQIAEARAAIDKRSGLYNRGYLERRIDAEAAAASRWGKPLACFMATIDNWENVSSALGPYNRDHFIRIAAEGIVASLRKEDVTCQWDARTFAILAFVTDEPHAVELGARIQQAVVDAGHMCGLISVEPTVTVAVTISRFSSGAQLMTRTEETLLDARERAKGEISFGGELSELRMTGWTVNEAALPLKHG